MSSETEHPTREDLLVMAYVDDELATEQRTLFQERLDKEPELQRQVAVYQKLAVLARQTAPAEPTDLEWERIQAAPVHRAGVGLGWTLLTAGSIGLLIAASITVLTAELNLLEKILLLAPSLGHVLLVLIRLRDRLRLIPFDPYTEVKR